MWGGIAPPLLCVAGCLVSLFQFWESNLNIVPSLVFINHFYKKRDKELAHMEMISAIVYQLTKDLTPEEIKASGFDKYYVDHTLALWPQSAGGTPWTATYFQSKGDPITDLHEDMAAEQKARTTYDNILRLVKDPEVADPIRFLREREIVHYQRFGESLRIVQDRLDSRNFYAFNPEFDHQNSGKCCN